MNNNALQIYSWESGQKETDVCVRGQHWMLVQVLFKTYDRCLIATSGRTWEFSSAEILASNELVSSTTRVVLFPERTGRPAGRPDQLGQRGIDRMKHFSPFLS